MIPCGVNVFVNEIVFSKFFFRFRFLSDVESVTNFTCLRAMSMMVVYRSTGIRWLGRQGGFPKIWHWVTLLVMSDNKASYGTVSREITKAKRLDNVWINLLFSRSVQDLASAG